MVILSPTDYIQFLDNLTSWTSDELLDRYGLDPSDFSPNIMASVKKNGKITHTSWDLLSSHHNIDHLKAAGLEPSSAEQDSSQYVRSDRQNGDGTIDQWGWYSWRMAVQGSVAWYTLSQAAVLF